MNILANNPTATLHVAHQTVADRIDEARLRATTRAVRALRRAARGARPAAERPASSAPAAAPTTWFARAAR